jgi:hypothetical protein
MAEQTQQSSMAGIAQEGPKVVSIRRVMTDQGNKAQRLMRVDQM